MATRTRTQLPPPKSEGERLLRATGESSRAIGARVDVTHSTAARWLKGVRDPEIEHARQLQAVYSIPVGAWSQRPQGLAHETPAPQLQAPQEAPAAPRPPESSSSAHEAPTAPLTAGEAFTAFRLSLEHLEAVRGDLARASAEGLAGDVAKFRSLERHAINQVAKLEEQIPVTRERLKQSDEWKASMRELAELVGKMGEKHPEAAAWLVDEVRRLRVGFTPAPVRDLFDGERLLYRLRQDVERGGAIPTRLVAMALRHADVDQFVADSPERAQEVLDLMDQVAPLPPEARAIDHEDAAEAHRYLDRIRAAFRRRELLASFGRDFGAVAAARLTEILELATPTAERK